jgi:hypothetical protein
METGVEFTETFAACGNSLLPRVFVPRVFVKGRQTMKPALIAIASAGILAVTAEVESANAQAYNPYSAPRTYASPAYPPQTRGSVRRGAPRTAPRFNPDSPEATGGGSLGYNQNLWNW